MACRLGFTFMDSGVASRSAGLQAPNGAVFFVLVIGGCLLLHLIGPMLVRAWRSPPPRKEQVLVAGTSSGTASATIAFLAAACVWTSQPCRAGTEATQRVLPDIISQAFRVEDKVAVAVARIRWQAEKGQSLPLLLEPAVLTRISYPTDALRLERTLIADTAAS